MSITVLTNDISRSGAGDVLVLLISFKTFFYGVRGGIFLGGFGNRLLRGYGFMSGRWTVGYK